MYSKHYFYQKNFCIHASIKHKNIEEIESNFYFKFDLNLKKLLILLINSLIKLNQTEFVSKKKKGEEEEESIKLCLYFHIKFKSS